MTQTRSGDVGPVLFYHVSTRRIIECTIGFEAVAGVREGSHVKLALVEVRLDDLVENPAWRQKTGSSIPERCLMFLTIWRDSGGRGRSGKHVGNTGNHSGKLLPVSAATVEFDGNRLGLSGTVEKPRVPHRAPSGKITSGLVPPCWNSTEIVQASLEQSRCIENRGPVSAGGVVEGVVRLEQSFLPFSNKCRLGGPCHHVPPSIAGLALHSHHASLYIENSANFRDRPSLKPHREQLAYLRTLYLLKIGR